MMQSLVFISHLAVWLLGHKPVGCLVNHSGPICDSLTITGRTAMTCLLLMEIPDPDGVKCNYLGYSLTFPPPRGCRICWRHCQEISFRMNCNNSASLSQSQLLPHFRWQLIASSNECRWGNFSLIVQHEKDMLDGKKKKTWRHSGNGKNYSSFKLPNITALKHVYCLASCFTTAPGSVILFIYLCLNESFACTVVLLIEILYFISPLLN